MAIVYPPDRTPGGVTTIYLMVQRGQRALRSRRKMRNVRAGRKEKHVKEDQAGMREMKHYLIPHLPKSDL